MGLTWRQRIIAIVLGTLFAAAQHALPALVGRY
jgi:purine-cytosine permease-like protein